MRDVLHYRRLPVLSVTRSLTFRGADAALSAIICTDQVDRAGQILDPRGMLADNFAANPMLLYMHGQDAKVGSWPVGRVLQLSAGKDAIQADIQFDVGSALLGDQRIKIGAELARLYADGWLRAFSVGFIPLEQETDASGCLRFTSWELVELSCVAVPLDPGSLVQGRAGTGRRQLDADSSDEELTGYARELLEKFGSDSADGVSVEDAIAAYGVDPDKPLWSPPE